MKKHTPTSGFALVIALSLMAFVLLLLLSITTLVQVESRNSAITLDQLEARVNAQLGAMVALGDLQKLAGPDQRVTARSDILILPKNDTNYVAPKVGQAQWTGVWSSKSNTSDADDVSVGLDSHQPQWLVSGDLRAENLVDGSNQLIKAATGAGSITLASVGNAVAQPEREVSVLKEPILGRNEQSLGEYAYWVSDEGVKARVNRPDTYNPSSTDADEYFRQAMAQQADASAVSTWASQQVDEPSYKRDYVHPYVASATSDSVWKAAPVGGGKVASVANIPLLLAGADAPVLNREFFHDLTVHSNSLLTNTRDGGLKRDLSAALRNLPADLESSLMFPNSRGNSGLHNSDVAKGMDVDTTNYPWGDPGGPRWRQLADHYQYSLDHSDLGLGDAIQVRPHSNDQVAIAPVITRFNFILQAIATYTGGAPSGPDDDPANDATNYTYHLGSFPVISLWNPYDHPLELGDLGLYVTISGYSLVHDEHTSPDPVWLGGLFDITDKKSLREQSDDRIDDKLGSIGFTIKGGTIPAGAVVNFSPANNSIHSEDPSQNVLIAGSTGDLVRGFFSPTLAGISIDESRLIPTDTDGNPTGPAPKLSMFDEFGDCRMRIYTANEAFVRVSLSTDNTKNDRDSRLLHMVTNGMNIDGLLPRVIPMGADQFGALSMGNVGSSVGMNSVDVNTPFDLTQMQLWTHRNVSASGHPGTMAGVSMAMNLPRSEIRNLGDPDSDSQRIHLLNQMNPRSPLQTKQVHLRAGNYQYRMYDPGPEVESNSLRARNFSIGTDTTEGYIGLANTSDGGGEGSLEMVLYEAPVTIPMSIGQLMHANLNNVYRLAPQLHSSQWNSNVQPLHATPAYAIGNSFANIHLPLNHTRLNIELDQDVYYATPPNKQKWGETGAHYDYSYELNHALWDGFFFSTILPDAPAGNPTANPASVVFPLPNSRMKKWSDVANDSADLVTENRVAANLLLEGGFNINSTSVAAWESILGAMRDVDTLAGSGGPSVAEAKHNYSRVAGPFLDSTGEIPSYASDPDAISAGYRSLTDDQISALAVEIVDEIKTRRAGYGHPFLSLSEFVNRALLDPTSVPSGLKKRFAFCGPLQFAIDQSGVNGVPALDKDWNDASGSDGLWNNGYMTPGAPTGERYHKDSLETIMNRPYLDSAAGSLSQADVLAKIGALITPRSDTFTIRTYGNSMDSITGASKASAYLEMVVQRTPQYVDASGNNEAYELPKNSENERFGRRFEIISSRWIAEDEI